MEKKIKIHVYKNPNSNDWGEWGATIDIGDSQIQVISPSKRERDKTVTLIKKLKFHL